MVSRRCGVVNPFSCTRDGMDREPGCRAPSSSASRTEPRVSSLLPHLSLGWASFFRVGSGSSVEPSMERMQIADQLEERVVKLQLSVP